MSADFPARLRRVTQEFGSRYALAKASEIPASTLQSYELGSKPGMDALVTLAKVANVDVRWLLTGEGEMRSAGTLPGASLADVIMVDQYELGAALSSQIVVGQIPFSRHLLESAAGLKEPSHKTLLAVAAARDLSEIRRRDLVLVDRRQARFCGDGVYVVDFPGLELREILSAPKGMVTIIGGESRGVRRTAGKRNDNRKLSLQSVQCSLLELSDGDPDSALKIVGRAVWIGRVISA